MVVLLLAAVLVDEMGYQVPLGPNAGTAYTPQWV